jgi:hypothetical protein
MYSVTELCGAKLTEENFISFDIDGNFIFENDPNFNSIKLTNKFNRSIMVNSHEECEHYVLGGWDRTETLNVEYFSQYLLIILLVVAIVKRKFFFTINYEN